MSKSPTTGNTKSDAKKSSQPYRLSYEMGAEARAPKATPAAHAVPAARSSDGESSQTSHKAITWSIVGVAAFAILTSLVFGNSITALAVAIVCLTMLQGLWRGAAEVFGVVVAMIFAVVLAPPIGRAFEGLTHSLFGTGGIANRLLSMGLVALVITIALAAVIGTLARKWLKKRPKWAAANKYVGAGLGLIEGSFIAALLFWAILMLEPIARSQLATAEPNSNPVAQRVVAAAATARASAFGSLAQATNPLPDTDLVALIGDFAAITSHPEAREHFLKSPAIKKLEDLPSLKAALDDVKNDPELAGLVGDEGATADDVYKFLNSPTILRIIDKGDATRDLQPLVEDLKSAIREAKAKIGPT